VPEVSFTYSGMVEQDQIFARQVANTPMVMANALHTAMDGPYRASQALVPVDTGRLKLTGQHPPPEIAATFVTDLISYGRQEPREDGGTLVGWGGARSAGYGRVLRRPRRRQFSGAIWADVGYEVFVHEGTHGGIHPNPPQKFLEGPIMESMAEFGQVLGRAFAEEMAGGR
jgi:hypothetical protein